MGKIAVAFVLVLFLAGCSGKGNNTSDTGNQTVATSGSVSSHGTGAAGNRAPTGSVHDSVATGMAPLKVNFTLDGSDPDKDPITWTLDVNGDGKTDASGKKLPATFEYTYHVAGVFNVTFKISDGNLDVSLPLVVTVTPNQASGQSYFTDGAEGDASLWTFSNEVVPEAEGVAAPTGQKHPLGDWSQVTTQFRGGAKSWHAPYPDNYVGTMTLAKAITLPDGGATVSFWAKGGAEDNTYDGLHVLAGPDAGTLEEQIYQATVYKDWTQFSFHVDNAGPLVLQFVFKGDSSCSSDPVPVGGANGTACGAGWDAGGFWVDDILVS